MQKGIKYEIFTKRLFQTLTRLYPDTFIQHNIVLNGNQIDVLWRHKVAGFEHKTIIECKDYNKRIDLDIFRTLTARMDECRTNGALVTTVGFQEGVITKARERGDVKLLVIEYTTQPGGTLEFGISKLDYVQLSYDPVTTTHKQNEILSLMHREGHSGNLPVHDAENNLRGTVNSLIEETIEQDSSSGEHFIKLDYLYAKLPNGQLVKLDKLEYSLSFHPVKCGIELRAEQLIANVHDVLENHTEVIYVEDDADDFKF